MIILLGIVTRGEGGEVYKSSLLPNMSYRHRRYSQGEGDGRSTGPRRAEDSCVAEARKRSGGRFAPGALSGRELAHCRKVSGQGAPESRRGSYGRRSFGYGHRYSGRPGDDDWERRVEGESGLYGQGSGDGRSKGPRRAEDSCVAEVRKRSGGRFAPGALSSGDLAHCRKVSGQGSPKSRRGSYGRREGRYGHGRLSYGRHYGEEEMSSGSESESEEYGARDGRSSQHKRKEDACVLGKRWKNLREGKGFGPLSEDQLDECRHKSGYGHGERRMSYKRSEESGYGHGERRLSYGRHEESDNGHGERRMSYQRR